MAITLAAGEVANNCDTDNFTPGDIGDGDIIAKQGTQYIGLKVSNGTNTFITTTLGAGAPYDFSATGAEAGYHIIMWFAALTAVNATTGFRIYAQDSTTSDNGFWSFAPPTGYSGGWVSRVIDPTTNFTGAAGTWTTTGNPAQLTAVAGMGGGFTTITMIAGNFQNVNIDQITVGTGLRADAGTVTVPNTWEIIRAADEGTSSANYGWLSSAAGGFIAKGGIFLGPATGSATSVFNDTASVVLFADEPIADGFYQINIRGTGTTVDFIRNLIRTEDPSGNVNSRWDLTIDGTDEPTFDDTDSLFAGSGDITLQTSSTLTGTTLDDGTSLVQNGATLNGVTVQNANTGDGVAYITCDDIAAISNCDFNFSDGHALELTSAHAADPSTHAFSNNSFTGYAGTPGSNLVAASGSNDAAIYNNSGKDLIINITGGGDTPSVRNGAGATTVVNNTVTLEIQVNDALGNAVEGVRCAIFERTGLVQGAEIASGETNASGTFTDSNYSYSGDQDIFAKARLRGFIPFVTTGTITADGFTLGILFQTDTIVD
jgi:hypothetical protein